MQKADDGYKVIWLVRRLFRALAQKSTESLQDLGVSAADRAVLEFLYPDEELSVPEIAERYQVSRQHVQVTVNALLDSGLLRTKPNPRHKRSSLIALSGKGSALFQKIRRRDEQAVARLFADIPARNREATRKTLATLLAKLN